jgi:hypothetical protein
MSAVWRWRTSNVPTWNGRPVTAFMPLVTKTAETWQRFKEWLDGQPGTEAIPAPNNEIPRSKFWVGDGQRYALDTNGAWYPQLWYQTQAGLGTLTGQYPGGGNDSGVCIYSDNQLPVPAVDPTRDTYRYGGGKVHPVFMQPQRPSNTVRTVSPYNG